MAAAAKQVSANITTEDFKTLLIETNQDKGDEGYGLVFNLYLYEFASIIGL